MKNIFTCGGLFSSLHSLFFAVQLCHVNSRHVFSCTAARSKILFCFWLSLLHSILDFVLVYVEPEKGTPNAKHLQFREKFLSNLKKSKVEMEEVMVMFDVIWDWVVGISMSRLGKLAQQCGLWSDVWQCNLKFSCIKSCSWVYQKDTSFQIYLLLKYLIQP